MEVLISVAILSIALIAVLKSSLQIQDTLIKSQEKTIISLLAANKIAEVKAAGADNWNDNFGRFQNYPSYSWELNISDTAKNSFMTISINLLDTESKKKIKTIEERIFMPQKPW